MWSYIKNDRRFFAQNGVYITIKKLAASFRDTLYSTKNTGHIILYVLTNCHTKMPTLKADLELQG